MNHFWSSLSRKIIAFSMFLVFKPSWHTSISTNNMEMLSPNVCVLRPLVHISSPPTTENLIFKKTPNFCKLKNDFAPDVHNYLNISQGKARNFEKLSPNWIPRECYINYSLRINCRNSNCYTLYIVVTMIFFVTLSRNNSQVICLHKNCF